MSIPSPCQTASVRGLVVLIAVGTLLACHQDSPNAEATGPGGYTPTSDWTEPVELSQEERKLIERILLKGTADPEVSGSPLLDPLRERLGLGRG